jgi:D-alanyl-lipoteichoic acid acyltransferase DltB (MBOAT superfamily)
VIFNSLGFVAFFVCFFCAFSFVAKTDRQRLWLITISSVFFYGCWNYKFVPLLVGTGLIDFYIARAISLQSDNKRRKRLLVLSVAMNLGVLGIFKYTNFFVASGVQLLASFGLHMKAPVVDVVLPIGISFYTFQSISYTVDVYRGTLKARKRIHEFLAALSFFPHLVAGPIVRSSFILPQFDRWTAPRWEACKQGFLLIIFGLTKKTMADLMGAEADLLFASAGPHSALESWTAALTFTGQIYGDFSGYSDMALGIAALLGYTLPPNFNLPYLARTPVEFWRRWHISFSTWLRDYLYIPLGGNRTRPQANLLLTMVLGGLWHGASWMFVLWGLYHGVLLAATHAIRRRFEKRPTLPAPILVGVTFYFVIVGWVLFRATTLRSAWSIIRGMLAPVKASIWQATSIYVPILTVVAIVFCHAIDYLASHKQSQMLRGRVLWPVTVVLLAFALLYHGNARTFIYFQF